MDNPSIPAFEEFVPLDVDVRKQVLEAEGTKEDVPKLSLDDDTQDKLQMKILCYMSMLVERLECIYVFCRQFRAEGPLTLHVFWA